MIAEYFVEIEQLLRLKPTADAQFNDNYIQLKQKRCKVEV